MALSLNKALIIGNCTRDPEVRTVPSGQSVASFGVATNRRWKDRQTGDMKEQAEFHNVVAWGRLAEISGQYLKKGGRVYVEGRLQTRSWDDQTGAKKQRTEVIAEQIILLDRPGQQSGAGTLPADQPSQGRTGQEAVPPAEEEINIEDIPF